MGRCRQHGEAMTTPEGSQFCMKSINKFESVEGNLFHSSFDSLHTIVAPCAPAEAAGCTYVGTPPTHHSIHTRDVSISSPINSSVTAVALNRCRPTRSST